jgi:acetyl-CoA synthetase
LNTQAVKLTDLTSAADAYRYFSHDQLWQLFDGDRDALNIAHECLDRHVDKGTAMTIVRDGVAHQSLTFRELSEWSARFANWLERQGIGPGDRIAVMLEPSLAFYTAIFGAMKAGAVAVPLFTLFGPDGLRSRVDDCEPKLLLANDETIEVAKQVAPITTRLADKALFDELANFSAAYTPRTRANDLALLQYTSGTTRERPAAIPHTHRAVVTVALAALYGLGIRPGDRYFCPSSPAWGHGMWHGTISPLALGVPSGTYAGRFNIDTLLSALSQLSITNLAAASTIYRMMRNAPKARQLRYVINKLSFTGEPMDSATAEFVAEFFGTPACSMYGTTETGVIIVNFPGATDFAVRPGALGKPMPGVELEVHDNDGNPVSTDTTAQIMLKRRGEWFATKDLGRIDADGYFHHAGRADDVIISAGWTMSAAEIEDVLLRHPQVVECAVIGVPDEIRGHVVKAFIITNTARGETAADTLDDDLAESLKAFTRERLSRHEYPREVVFVSELPKTPAGKINRRILREQEQSRREAASFTSTTESLD